MQIDLNNINAPNEKVLEKHGYFEREGKHLYCAEYLPASGAESGFVLCSPFGEEKVRTLRVYVSFARALASLGVAVICFDYYGDGDSEGNFEEATFDDRTADIRAIYNDFRTKHALKKMGLMGLRWGGTLAALLSEELQPETLILWEPVIDTAKYFYDHLRAFLASQMLIEGKVTRNREELIKELEGGKILTVEGYNLTGRFFFGAREATLKGRKYDYRGNSLIIQISPSPGKIRPELEELKSNLGNSELVSLPREFEWEKTETWRPAPPQLFGETFNFLDKNGFFGRNTQS
ncbi:MAG: alpha/beta hydrolase [candidate division Zixibacteria bacterium]|nr:alpha/beta hydrolase [candidate division Zixibacteria bacterium]